MSRKYTGDLSRPHQPPILGLLASDEQKEVWHTEVTTEQVRRMGLLFEDYELKAGDWEGLAWRLALDHVSGMTLGKKAGRVTKWGEFYGALLVLTVEEIVEHTGFPVSTVAEALAGHEPWKSITKGSTGAVQLRNRYHNHRESHWIPLLRHYRGLLIETGEISGKAGEFAQHYYATIDMHDKE